MVKETSPLLSKASSNYQANSSNTNGDSSSLDSVVTANGDYVDAAQKADDDLLKRRLNGASIYAVSSGYVIFDLNTLVLLYLSSIKLFTIDSGLQLFYLR